MTPVQAWDLIADAWGLGLVLGFAVLLTRWMRP